MVDFGSFDIDAGISRNASFCTTTYDGAHAAGRDGKSDGPSDLRHYSWRWLCYIEAGDPWNDATRIDAISAAAVIDRPQRKRDGKKFIVGGREVL